MYKEKYLKYKTKYLELKNLLGGGEKGKSDETKYRGKDNNISYSFTFPTAILENTDNKYALSLSYGAGFTYIHISDNKNIEYVIWKEGLHPRPNLPLWEKKNITSSEKLIVKELISDSIDIINKLVEHGEITFDFDKEFRKKSYLRNCLQELENFKIKIDSITSSEQGKQIEQSEQGKQTEQSDEFIESSEQGKQIKQSEQGNQTEQSDEFIERSKEDEDKKRTTLMI
jgi:hypothetical protein